MNTAGQLGGFLSTVLFGYLVDAYGNYNLPIFVIAGMLAASACLFWQIDASKPLLEDAPPTVLPSALTSSE
jgi:MFS family permease